MQGSWQLVYLYPFIHLFNKYLLSTNQILDSAIDSRDSEKNVLVPAPCAICRGEPTGGGDCEGGHSIDVDLG